MPTLAHFAFYTAWTSVIIAQLVATWKAALPAGLKSTGRSQCRNQMHPHSTAMNNKWPVDRWRKTTPPDTRRKHTGHVYYLDTNGHLQGTRLNVATSITKCLQQIHSKLRLKVEQVAGWLITTKIVPDNESCNR